MFWSTRWYARELERRERAWATERAELIGTICRLAGKPLPAAPAPPPAPPQPRTWSASPEQDPIS